MMRALAALLLVAPLGGQEVVWKATGTWEYSQLGRQIHVLGDVNSDGFHDLMVLASVVPAPGQCCETQVWTLSGKDGSVVSILRPPGILWSLSPFCRMGDVDGDGVTDYAVRTLYARGGLRPPHTVQVRGGKDNRLLWFVQGPWNDLFGEALLGDLDLDGDKKPDLVVTAPRGTKYGSVFAYSSQGKLLYRIDGTSALSIGVYQSDETLGRLGDVDGDGADDFVVGGAGPGRGAAVMISGKTGKILRVAYDQKRGDLIGASVAGCGDVDGDGVPDLAAFTDAFAGPRPPVLIVYSGRTAKVIHRIPGLVATALANDPYDFDLDGVPDLVVGAAGQNSPRPGALLVLSGRTGKPVWRVDGVALPQAAREIEFGRDVCALPPPPGSRFPLVATTAGLFGPNTKSPNPPLARGMVALFRGSPPSLRAYGMPCRGTLAAIPRLGVHDLGPSGGKGLRLSVTRAPAGAPAVLFLGASRTRYAGLHLPLPLGVFGFPGCLLRTSVDAMYPTLCGTTGLASGYGHVDLPAVPSLKGATTGYAQWLVLGPGPRLSGALTGALSGRF